MTIECSAYCRPDEGVHVFVTGWDQPLEASRERYLGWMSETAGTPWSCVEGGLLARIVAIDDAPEAVRPDELPLVYRFLSLLTVQVQP